MALATAFLVTLLASPFAFSDAQTTVDWSLGKDYSSYTSQSFKPGGTIQFNYNTPAHNVVVVSKTDYEKCNAGNALQTFSDGKTSITLKKGAMYFICGIPGHCTGGMKLQVNVGDSGSPTSAPTPTPTLTPISTPATPPAPPTSRTPTMTKTTPTPSITTPAAPSPKDSSSGAVGLSSVGHLIFGMPLVLGAIFAIIC